MLRYLRTVRTEVHAFVFASLLVLLFKKLFLDTIPEWFSGGKVLGDIVEHLCESIFSGYLFYLIVVHMEWVNDKVTVNPYVVGKVRRIVADCESQLSEFSRASGVELTLETITTVSVEASFKKINPLLWKTLLFPRDGGDALNLLQYVDCYRERTSKTIENLFQQARYLDSQLSHYLTNIDDCDYFKKTQFFVEKPLTSMEILASPFFDYCVLVRTLDAYEKLELAIYQPGRYPAGKIE